ncbi:MAG: hypothetical protein AAGF77_14070 [Bacteroidota bacterium]
MKKFKSHHAFLFVLCLLFSSCQKDENEVEFVSSIEPIEYNMTLEEFIKELENDPVAVNYANQVDKVQNLIKTSVAKRKLSANEFREIYEAKDNEKLDDILGGTNLIEESERLRRSAVAFAEKYPNIQEELNGLITESKLEVVERESKTFAFLDSNSLTASCAYGNPSWWVARICQLGCVVSGVACTPALTPYIGPYAPYVCALSGFACFNWCFDIMCAG